MGPRFTFLGFFLAVFLAASFGWAKPQIPLNPTPGPTPKPEALGPWALVKQKVYPNYKVELHQRSTIGKFPRVESSKVRIIPTEGGSVTQSQGTWINPDPKSFVADYQGGPIDLDGDGIEDLLLQNYTAGVHCCFNYILYSLAKPIKKLGNLDLKDCGGQIRVADLNQDKKMEILTCSAAYIYLGKIPFSDSPFPPAVYSLKDGTYKRSDLDFKEVFLQDIQKQREALAQGYDAGAALQLVADYFILGEEGQAWKEFEALYQGEDKDTVRGQLLQRLGKPATPAAAATPPPTVPPPLSKAVPTPAPAKPSESVSVPPPKPPAGFPQAPPDMPKLP